MRCRMPSFCMEKSWRECWQKVGKPSVLNEGAVVFWRTYQCCQKSKNLVHIIN
jgi:hypothetical protein